MRRFLALTMAFACCGVLAISADAHWRKPKPPRKPPMTTPTPPPPTTTPGTVQNPAPPAGYSIPPNSYGFAKDTVEHALPTRTNFWAIPWAEAIVDTRIPGGGTVQMKYLRLWATVSGQTVLAADSEYDSEPMTGGFFVRVPWYGGNGVPITTWTQPATAPGITLMITDPNVVYHWWNSYGRVNVTGASAVWVETCVKITGSAAFDFGWDYWSAESGGSDLEGASTRFYWASDCHEFTVLTIGRPAG